MSFSGAAFVFSGVAAILAGFIRLGWRRHGALPTDFRFLHLDWVVHPSLPYWRAHIANLSLLLGGFVSIALGLAVVTTKRSSPTIAERGEPRSKGR